MRFVNIKSDRCKNLLGSRIGFHPKRGKSPAKQRFLIYVVDYVGPEIGASGEGWVFVQQAIYHTHVKCHKNSSCSNKQRSEQADDPRNSPLYIKSSNKIEYTQSKNRNQ